MFSEYIPATMESWKVFPSGMGLWRLSLMWSTSPTSKSEAQSQQIFLGYSALSLRIFSFQKRLGLQPVRGQRYCSSRSAGTCLGEPAAAVAADEPALADEPAPLAGGGVEAAGEAAGGEDPAVEDDAFVAVLEVWRLWRGMDVRCLLTEGEKEGGSCSGGVSCDL
ncbi:unnamed protein product [Ectocarpus sp. 12 AP-2014]